MPKALFEQDKISLPVSKLATVRDIIRAEQDADITIELGLLALSGPTWATGFPMLRQIPPKLLIHAFLGLDVAIDRFLADAQFGAFVDHAIADLFRRPTLFDPRDHGLAQVRMPEQLSLH